MKYSIKNSYLFSDVKTPYNNETNTLIAYMKNGWIATSEDDYYQKVNKVSDYKFDNDLFKIRLHSELRDKCWEVLPYERNYISVIVRLKKDAEEYTEGETERLREILIVIRARFCSPY